MKNNSQSTPQDVFKMSILVSYTGFLNDGSITEPLQTRFTLEAEQINSLFGLLFNHEQSFTNPPETGIIELKGDRLKDSLPALYDSIMHHLSEELKCKALADNVNRFELLIDNDDLRKKGIAIAYTIEMFKIGRRAELHRRDREQGKSNH